MNRRCLQITTSNQNGDHTNQYPACYYWKYHSICRPWAFSDKAVQNYWITEVSQYAIWKVPHHGHESSNLTQGLRRHLLKTNRSNDASALLRIMRQGSFPSVSRIRVELIRRTVRLVFVCTVQGRLVVAVYISGHPDRCSKLTPGHRCYHRHTAFGATEGISTAEKDCWLGLDKSDSRQ